jgi:hypothetical protein
MDLVLADNKFVEAVTTDSFLNFRISRTPKLA